MRLRLWPDSIFGRFLAVLLASCALAQIVATTLVIHRGGNLVAGREAPMMEEAARRVSDILTTLGSLAQEERRAALRSLDGRPIDIDLTRMPPPAGGPAPALPPPMLFGVGIPGPGTARQPQSRAEELIRRVRARVDPEIDLHVTVEPVPASERPRLLASTQFAPVLREFAVPSGATSLSEPDLVVAGTSQPASFVQRPQRGSASIMRETGIRLMASWPGEVPLTFRIASATTVIRREPMRFNFLVGLQLAGQLLVVFAGVCFGAYVAARRITSPLSRLAAAADSLGRSLNQPPVPETGPKELRQVAQGFNVMQDRLKRYIDSRTRVVAAMSHDLRTPLTRARLRLEMMEEGEHRREFERDLTEMEGMVLSTLDALTELGADEAIQEIDINELLSRLQFEFAELGHRFAIEGRAAGPYPARPQALKRCLSNLVDNAFKYGDEVSVLVTDGDWVQIAVCDQGPGIPPQELERVFEPFYRLESSRSRETGGTGLGLSVARDCAQAHGGRLILRNRRDGGLAAELSLPRGTSNRDR